MKELKKISTTFNGREQNRTVAELTFENGQYKITEIDGVKSRTFLLWDNGEDFDLAADYYDLYPKGYRDLFND